MPISIFCHIYRPHQDLLFPFSSTRNPCKLIEAAVGSIKIFHKIRHSCHRINQRIPQPILIQVINMGSLCHLEHLINRRISRLGQISSVQFQIPLAIPDGIKRMFRAFIIPQILRQTQTRQIIIQNIRIRPFHFSCIPHFFFSIYPQTINGLRTRITLFYIHSCHISHSISQNRHTLITVILCVSGRSDLNGIIKRHFRAFYIRMFLRIAPLFYFQLDWCIFHINPGIGTVYRPLDLLFHISFLIISDLIRIDFHCNRTAPDISRWCFYFCDHIHAST